MDFFKNFERALMPALNGEADCVVHGGDLLYRSKVPAKLVYMAFEPLKHVADNGTPIYLVPGNHERSVIPYRLLISHPNIHVFDGPRTYLLKINGKTLALAGFPYVRDRIRGIFPQILEQTGWKRTDADRYVLCIHQCIEGATVGPKNFTFRYNHDVIKTADIPSGFTAILSGHIHRFQVLTKDLRGDSISAPVFYAGSIERTSFVEKDEKKGYLTLDMKISGSKRNSLNNWMFHELPSRPMIRIELHTEKLWRKDFRSWIKGALEKLPKDSVVKIVIHGKTHKDSLMTLTTATLRSLAPATMNVNVTYADPIIPTERRRSIGSY